MIKNKKSSDKYELSASLQKVVKGTGLIFIGSIISLFFSFIGYVLIARNWTESDLGIYVLAFSVTGIFGTISSLGLNEGIIRCIAHSIGKKENEKLPDFITSSIFLSTLTSVILSIFLFLFSEEISQILFNENSLILPLKIFAVLLPFSALISLIVSIFRGFDNIRPTVYFDLILRSILFPSILIIVIFLDLSFINVFYAYASSIILTFIFLLIYALKNISFLPKFSMKSITSPFSKELIFFSLPLLGSAMIHTIVSWTDSLMLGSFKNAADVGLYNTASPLARFVSFPLTALIVAFIPIFSGLYGKGLLDEIRRNYSILTKWICSMTVPLFLILFLYPEASLNILFGPNYVPAAIVLRIISLAFIINNFSGPCGAMLLAMGKAKFILLANLATAVLNIAANALLIPFYGLVGAAVATGVSVVSINLIRSWKIYSLDKIHPISKNLIKPTVLSFGLIGPIYFISKQFLTIDFWSLSFLFLLFYGIYILSVLITKSLDDEDLKLLLAFEKRTGIRSKLIKKILTKFI